MNDIWSNGFTKKQLNDPEPLGPLPQQNESIIAQGDLKVSDHGYDELSSDNISVRDVVASLPDAALSSTGMR